MSKTRKSKTDYLRYAAVIILDVSLMAIALLLLNYREKQQGIFPTRDQDVGLNTTIKHNGKEYTLRSGVKTILFIGLDKFSESIDNSSYNNDQQADFLMLLVVDEKNGTASAVQINRDTMTEMNVLGVGGQKVGTTTAQIALSHTYGSGKNDSCRNTERAVSQFLNGVSIDHYVSLTMDAVQIINDMVGGVSVEVLHDFSSVDSTLIKGETVTLRGEHALQYIRGRQDVDDESNIQRMERQRQYLYALRGQVDTYADINTHFSSDVILELADHMVTDYSFDLMDDVIDMLLTYDITEIHTIDGELKEGEEHMEFYADAAAKKQLIVDLFYELNE